MDIQNNFKRFIKKCIIFESTFFIVFVILLFTNLPEYFDSYVYIENYKFNAHLWLIIYRILMYFTFPFIFTLFEKMKKNGKKVGIKLLLIENFNVQFCSYSIIASIYSILGLDVLLGVEIFGNSDAFLFITGFIFTTILHKGIPDLLS